MTKTHDQEVLRTLATQYRELCDSDRNRVAMARWRPIASIVSSEHFDEDLQRKQLGEGFEKLRGCNVEVHMHEPMTVQGDVTRIARWAEIAREEAERVCG